MDLRSIVHAEDTPDARKAPSLPPESPIKEISRPPPALYQPGNVGGGSYKNRAPNGQSQHDSRPSNPPPIRTASYHDSNLSSGSPGGLTKQHSYPVTRGKVFYFCGCCFCRGKLISMHEANVESNGPYPYPERGSASSSQGQYSFSTPLTHTPTGSSPGSVGAYSALQRPTSSHSGTPNSAHYQISGVVHRSPQASHNHNRVPSQPLPPQHYPPQPHTPLGPPSGRPSYTISHDSPSSYSHQRTFSSGSYGQQHPTETLPVSTRHLPSDRLLSAEIRPREQSVSVSPKTRIDTLPGAQPLNVIRNQDSKLNQQTHPVNLANEISDHQSDVSEREIKPVTRRSTSFAIEGLLNEVPANDTTQPGVTQTPRRISYDRELSNASSTQNYQPLVTPINPTPTPTEYQASISASDPISISRIASEVDERVTKMEGVLADSQPLPVNQGSHDRNLKHHLNDLSTKDDASQITPSLKNQPPRKKPRLENKVKNESSPPPSEDHRVSETPKAAPQPQKKQLRKREVPRFAQSVRKVGLPTNGHSTILSKGLAHETQPNTVPPTNDTVDSISEQMNGNHDSTTQPERKIGPLGAWEPSILDVEPVEDITKVISDWLFTEVVLKQGIGVGPAGGSASNGAVLEIEAKIGRLIDQHTNDRIRLPVATECIVSLTDPNLRINFESSMTEV